MLYVTVLSVIILSAVARKIVDELSHLTKCHSETCRWRGTATSSCLVMFNLTLYFVPRQIS